MQETCGAGGHGYDLTCKGLCVAGSVGHFTAATPQRSRPAASSSTGFRPGSLSCFDYAPNKARIGSPVCLDNLLEARRELVGLVERGGHLVGVDRLEDGAHSGAAVDSRPLQRILDLQQREWAAVKGLF